MYELIDQTELTGRTESGVPTEGNVLGVRVSGTVTGDDYERVRPSSTSASGLSSTSTRRCLPATPAASSSAGRARRSSRS